ncbi:MAG: bifunctional phosphoribosylaminoimidazolecarboxamide formyltransferase/IMP cyclohydrolase PurH, partial [Flavobacteriaceae bacterium]
MQETFRVSSALISVFDKKGLEPIVEKLYQLGVTIYSTGGTADYIDSLGFDVVRV